MCEGEEVLIAAKGRGDLLDNGEAGHHEGLPGLGELVGLAGHVAGGHGVVLLPGVVPAGKVLGGLHQQSDIVTTLG